MLKSYNVLMKPTKNMSAERRVLGSSCTGSQPPDPLLRHTCGASGAEVVALDAARPPAGGKTTGRGLAHALT